jgi:hypothetical protein
MTTSSWLSELPVLGKLPPEEAAERLREVGEEEFADALEAARSETPATYGWPKLSLRRDRAWRHTAHAIGHLVSGVGPYTTLTPIHHVGSISPDHSLKGARVTLTLDGLRVADYPGRGAHRVLFDFAAQNQLPEGTEQVHFNATYRAIEGEQAAVLGRPIFNGLHVGNEGIFLQCATVNVQNEADEAFLAFLETDAFTAGLTLATTVQPALVPFSTMAVALTKAIAGRNRNVAVQAVEVGLDFRSTMMGARLAEGSYVVVQIPETLQAVWRWQDWVYDPTNGHIVNRSENGKLLPYNYFVVSISRSEGN